MHQNSPSALSWSCRLQACYGNLETPTDFLLQIRSQHHPFAVELHMTELATSTDALKSQTDFCEESYMLTIDDLLLSENMQGARFVP